MKLKEFETLIAGIAFFGGMVIIAIGLGELNHAAKVIWWGACAMWIGKRIGKNLS